jgi:hypothetical protein
MRPFELGGKPLTSVSVHPRQCFDQDLHLIQARAA